jgi:hypothetical protein
MGSDMAFIVFFFLRRPWPTVAFIFADFTKTVSQDNSKHNETNLLTFILYTLMVQYCAWGTPSALSYYNNNIITMNTTFLTQKYIQARFDSAYIN